MNILQGSLFLLIGLLQVSCSTTPENSDALTPTELRASADVFDGKELVVRGWITLETEDVNIWTEKKDMASGRTIHCVSLADYGEFLPQAGLLNRRFVEIRGLFRKDVVGSSGAVRLGACSKTAIEPVSIQRL